MSRPADCSFTALLEQEVRDLVEGGRPLDEAIEMVADRIGVIPGDVAHYIGDDLRAPLDEGR